MKFSSTEEFEQHVHKCFGRIFDLLQKMNTVIKEGAEKEDQEKNWGAMSDLHDWVEDTILYCHLAWQYHRLSMGPRRADTWTASAAPGSEQPEQEQAAEEQPKEGKPN